MKKINIFEKLAEFLVAEQEELPAHLLQEEIELNALKCSKFEYGEWINGFELPVLVQILNSSDHYFHQSFPGLKSFSVTRRQTLARELEEHASVCPRCKQKVTRDLAWERQVDAAIFQNRGTLRRMFDSEEGAAEIDLGDCGNCGGDDMGLT